MKEFGNILIFICDLPLWCDHVQTYNIVGEGDRSFYLRLYNGKKLYIKCPFWQTNTYIEILTFKYLHTCSHTEIHSQVTAHSKGRIVCKFTGCHRQSSGHDRKFCVPPHGKILQSSTYSCEERRRPPWSLFFPSPDHSFPPDPHPWIGLKVGLHVISTQQGGWWVEERVPPPLLPPAVLRLRYKRQSGSLGHNKKQCTRFPEASEPHLFVCMWKLAKLWTTFFQTMWILNVIQRQDSYDFQHTNRLSNTTKI